MNRSFFKFCSAIAACLIALIFGTNPAQAQTFSNTSDATIGDSTRCGNTNVTRTFNVTGIGTVSDLNVGFLATHTWRGDIVATLQSPAPTATTVTLIESDTANTGNDDDYNILMDDDASVAINTGSADGPHNVNAPLYQHTVTPSNPLSAFTGQNADGTWVLTMCDDFNTENGTFLEASLIFSNPTGADLSLSSSVSDSFPETGETITLTYNLTNSGPSTTTGVTVDIDLPPFLDFTSSSGTGSYNEVTGIWTIPGTAGLGTTSITLTADVISQSSGTVTAEVASSSQTDSDSTPGNNDTGEDDYDSTTIFVQPPPTPPAMSCPAVDQFVHAWDAPGGTNGWNSGDITNSYTAAGVPLTFTISGDTANLGQINGVNSPVTQDTYSGGLSPAEFSIGFGADHNNTSEELVVTLDINGGTGVQELQFAAFDVDQGGWTDRLTVTGELNGTTVFPTLTPSARNYIVGNSAIGQNGNAGNADGTGNVTVTFTSPINRVTIAYGNDISAGPNPAFQIVALHSFTMCPRLLANVTAVKTVEVYDPASAGLYMTPGNEVLYRITVNNDASATAQAEDIDLSDTLPGNVRFVSATTTGFTGGSFGSPALPAANTDCDGGACVVRFSNATLPINATGEIQIRALIK
ncbi:DUF11 domain-containing protein [Hellea balneolensis]|uniref:DUF11 domain-containing protein n=1 Tax=Hellea balneolensis TaxID=287478 RepID=UPI0004130256|nr:DUF11 domain-containing protein [Hellea balneolensis]